MNEKVVSLPPKKRTGDPSDVALNALRNAIETGQRFALAIEDASGSTFHRQASADHGAGGVVGRLDALVGANPRTVAVLYARADSNYKLLPDTDVYDVERDARTYDGPWPVVAHPPCRAWGRLSHMSNPRADEKNLARLAVALVREFGGVLEHPKDSRLWPAQMLPEPGRRDAYGGWTCGVTQHWWGHRATKATRLYIVGCAPQDLPELPPMQLGDGTHVVAQDCRKGNGGRRLKVGDQGYRPFLTKPEREHTPMEFAIWLCELARRCVRSNAAGNAPGGRAATDRSR